MDTHVAMNGISEFVSRSRPAIVQWRHCGVVRFDQVFTENAASSFGK
jgi:hypothetical protein